MEYRIHYYLPGMYHDVTILFVDEWQNAAESQKSKSNTDVDFYTRILRTKLGTYCVCTVYLQYWYPVHTLCNNARLMHVPSTSPVLYGICTLCCTVKLTLSG